MRPPLWKTLAGVFVVLLSALLVYVFSASPVWWLVSRGVLSWPTFRAIYKPIAFLEEGSYGGVFDKYIYWWAPVNVGHSEITVSEAK